MVSDSIGVDDVEDALASDDEAVAESLAFRRVLTRLELWILAFVVASKITDNVRVLRFGEDEGRGVMGFKFLQGGCKVKASKGVGLADLQRTKCHSLQKACYQPLYPPNSKGSFLKYCEEP